MPLYIVGIVIFLVVVIVGKWLSDGALKRLPDNEKRQLIDGFSVYRRYSLLPILLLMVLYFLGITMLPVLFRQMSAIFLAIVFCYIIIFNVLLQLKLRRLSMPANYRRTVLVVRILNLTAIATMFLLVVQ